MTENLENRLITFSRETDEQKQKRTTTEIQSIEYSREINSFYIIIMVFEKEHCYPAKEVWGKAMFLHLSVSHSVHGGRRWLCLPNCMLGYTPHRQTPLPTYRHPTLPRIQRYTVNKRAVRILLKCILELLMQ